MLAGTLMRVCTTRIPPAERTTIERYPRSATKLVEQRERYGRSCAAGVLHMGSDEFRCFLRPKLSDTRILVS